MTKKKSHRFLWFIGKRLFFLAIVILIIWLAIYSGNSGYIWNIIRSSVSNNEPTPKPKEEDPKPQQVIIPIYFKEHKLYVNGLPCRDIDELEAKVVELQRRYHPKIVVVKFSKGPKDPFILADKVEKFIKDRQGLEIIIEETKKP